MCTNDSIRMFPIQDGQSVPWQEAERAYETYVNLYGARQSLERIAERGGFGRTEFQMLYEGKDPSEIGGDDGNEAFAVCGDGD